MEKRMRDMRYYVSNGAGFWCIMRWMVALAALAAAVTYMMVEWELEWQVLPMAALWLWWKTLWMAKNVIVFAWRSRKLARTIGEGGEADDQLAEFETAQSLYDDEFRLGLRYVFARKGGVIPCRDIRRIYEVKEKSEDHAYRVIAVEDTEGKTRLLGRWEEKAFGDDIAWQIYQVLAERNPAITFEENEKDSPK